MLNGSLSLRNRIAPKKHTCMQSRRFNIPEQCRLPMTEEDLKTGRKMLEEDFIKANPAWVAELELMLQTKEKAEIQALSSFGFQYLTQVRDSAKIKQFKMKLCIHITAFAGSCCLLPGVEELVK